jgi:hypothetical protein
VAGVYQIVQIALPSGVWTAIAVPEFASYFSFKSQANNPIRIRTDYTNSATEDLLPGGYQEVFSTTPISSSPSSRWQPNTILFYAQPQSGSDVGILKWS